MFRIIGNVIEFDYHPVAVVLPEAWPTLRHYVEWSIDSSKAIDDLESEIKALEEENERLRQELKRVARVNP